MRLIYYLGLDTLKFLRAMGGMFIFLLTAIYYVFTPPFKFRALLNQIRFFGNRSVVVIVLTGAFTGMVLGLQIFYTLRKFGSEALLGPAVALSLIRELGPVLSALMVTGRAGSALTAEIGIMKITEQIDAILAMALNPIRYLVVPNIVAAIIVFPLLGGIFNLVGIYSGYIVSVKILGLSKGTYFSQIQTMLTPEDIKIGIIKSVFFGLIVSWVCCWKGYNVGHGAEGVSRATTEAVVLSSVLILVSDYLIGAFYL